MTDSPRSWIRPTDRSPSGAPESSTTRTSTLGNGRPSIGSCRVPEASAADGVARRCCSSATASTVSSSIGSAISDIEMTSVLSAAP